jgi:outer membrane protein assembly factor BamA
MKNPFKISLLLLLFIFGFTAYLRAEEILERIEVQGNQRTDSERIVEASELKLGEELTKARIEESRALIASKGVFESVTVENRRGADEHHRVLVFTIKEKTTWFIVPAFSFSQTGTSFGGVVGETNLFGHLKKVAIFGDYSKDAKRVAGGYRDSSFFGTHFTLSIDGILRVDNMAEYTDRREFRKVKVTEYGGTFLPGYRLLENVTIAMGPYIRHVNERIRSESPDIVLREGVANKGRDIAFVAEFEVKNSKNYDGIMSGTELKLSSQFSDERFFSDYDYNKQLIYLTNGITFWNKRANIVTHGSIQLGKNLPYYIELMAGGANLRGFLERQFRGDTKYAWGEEVMLPIYDFKRFILRTNLFWDSTLIYFKKDRNGNGEGLSRQKWHNGLGAGFRIHLKGIDLPLFGYDMAWGIEDKTYGYYLNVGAIF